MIIFPWDKVTLIGILLIDFGQRWEKMFRLHWKQVRWKLRGNLLHFFVIINILDWKDRHA